MYIWLEENKCFVETKSDKLDTKAGVAQEFRKKTCVHCGKEITTGDIIKGYVDKIRK
jgi:hypothetical protein